MKGKYYTRKQVEAQRRRAEMTLEERRVRRAELRKATGIHRKHSE